MLPNSAFENSGASELDSDVWLPPRPRRKRLHKQNPITPETNSPATVTPTEIPTNATVDKPDSLDSLAAIRDESVGCEFVAELVGESLFAEVVDGIDTDVADGKVSSTVIEPETLKVPELARELFTSDVYSAK